MESLCPVMQEFACNCVTFVYPDYLIAERIRRHGLKAVFFDVAVAMFKIGPLSANGRISMRNRR